jgi:SAM-dependent methyltransferase
MSVIVTSPPPAKDFSYASGERQTATELSKIRLDHSSRYKLAVIVSQEHWRARAEPLQILDLFCGNGYGSCMLARDLNAFVLGVDGCHDAIRVASIHYNTPRTTFSAKLFPFDLPLATYDLVTCFESIEHVPDPDALFAALAGSLKPGGVLIVSTPNERVMPLSINRGWFRHHIRHFTDADVASLARKHGNLQLAGRFGQRVYDLAADGRVIAVDPRLDMVPQADCEDAHFFVHLYQKPFAAEPAGQPGSAAV